MPDTSPLQGALDAVAPASAAPDGIPESALAGPFAVGEYAAALRTRLRSFTRVQVVGELVNLRPSRARVYFELRDAAGALSCAAWRDDWDRMVARAGTAPSEGMQVVVAGGCDYYPGSATSSPGFSFAVSDLRVAGEGDLLVRIDRLRKQLDAEGLLAPQKLLSLPSVPRSIGVITAEQGKAGDDVRAALARRGWAGRLVWAFAPVQDRHAAPAIVRALGDLAAFAQVDVVIVARGGGSLADLLCFCDETLCRTIALLSVPVIASVGHHTDRTLLDDVAAVSCSTPTHAAEAAVAVDCRRARDFRRSPRHDCARTPTEPCSTARACWRACRARRRRICGASTRACTSSCARCARARTGACRASAPSASAGRWCSSARPRPRWWTPAGAGRSSCSAWRWRWPRTSPSARSSAATRWSSRRPASR